MMTHEEREQERAHAEPVANTLASTTPIDPLRRVFVYNADRFRTTDGEVYVRDDKGTIYHRASRTRGKAARKAEKRARR